MSYFVHFLLCPHYVADFTSTAIIRVTLVIPYELHLLV